MSDDYFSGIPFHVYKKISTPVRIVLAAIIVIQFFGLFQFPPQILYTVAILSVFHLVSIGFEKAKLSTVEVAERKCPVCNIPLYSKVVKCERCGMQFDTDDKRS